MIREQSLVSGHPAVCHIVVGDICVYVREMKELFRFILREPPDSDLFTVGGEINETIFTPSFQLRSGAKRWFPLIKRC